jgi:hypothetical protein
MKPIVLFGQYIGLIQKLVGLFVQFADVTGVAPFKIGENSYSDRRRRC